MVVVKVGIHTKHSMGIFMLLLLLHIIIRKNQCSSSCNKGFFNGSMLDGSLGNLSRNIKTHYAWYMRVIRIIISQLLLLFVLFVQILTVVLQPYSYYFMPLCAFADMLELLVWICELALLRASVKLAIQ